MLKIRLKRVGKKNDPSFRVVVVDSKSGPQSGKDIERLGFYNPKTKEKSIDADRVKHWLSVGAQASGTMHNMLVSEGIVTGTKINVLPKKNPIVKEEEKAEETAAPVAEEGGEQAETPEVAEAPQEAPAEETPTETQEEKPAEEAQPVEEEKTEEPAVEPGQTPEEEKKEE